MFSGPLLASRRARQQAELWEASESCAERAAELHGSPSSTPGTVQGGSLSPRTPNRHDSASTATAAAAAAEAPPPRGRSARPQPTGPLPAASLGPETSLTDAPLLEELLPLLSESQGSAPRVRRLSTAGCALSLAKSILGVGVVAMPRAFLLLGAVPAGAAFVAVAALTQLSCRCLAGAARATGQLSYGGVLAAQLGPWAAAVLDVAMAANCFGMLTVYLIASGDVLEGLEQFAPAWLAPLLERRWALLALLCAGVVAPLLSLRRLKHSQAAFGLGMAAMGLWVGATFYLAAVLALKGEARPLSPWPSPQLMADRPWLHATAALNVVLLAFLCQMAFLPVVREMEHPVSPQRMTRASGAAIAASLTVMLALAAGSEVAFGGDIRDNVLSNFSVECIRRLLSDRHAGLAVALALGVRTAYLLSILATFPLQMQPLRDSVPSLRRPRASYWDLQTEVELHGWRFYAFTYAALVVACLLAIWLPSVWAPLQLLGATSGSAIAFILPGALALSMAGWRLWGWAGAQGLLLILVGLLLAAAGITKAVLGLLA